MAANSMDFTGRTVVQQAYRLKRHPYSVVAEKHIQPYWDMATQYVFADRTFTTQASGSFTAHQDLIRGDTLINSTQAIVDYPGHMPYGVAPLTNDVTSLITTSNRPNALQYLGNQGPIRALLTRRCATCSTQRMFHGILHADLARNDGQEWDAFSAVKAVYSDKGGEYPSKAQPYTCTQSCVSWPETNVLLRSFGKDY